VSWRYQLPVRSPISARGLAAGIAGLVRDPAAARRAVLDWIDQRFHPLDSLLTDSGTSALTLAFRGLSARGIRRVALPSYACYDLATAADGSDLEVVLYDLDPDTLGPAWGSYHEAFSRGAGAVVLVHLFGVPGDLSEAGRIAAAYQAVVIEDAAQGVGGAYADQSLGSFGSLAILSFGRGKGLTGGGGGALLAHDEVGRAVIERVSPSLGKPDAGGRALAASSVQWILARPAVYRVPVALPFLHLGETVYRAPGLCRQIAPSCVSMLATALHSVDGESAARKRNAAKLRDVVQEAGVLRPPSPLPEAVPGYLRLPVVVPQRFLESCASAEARALGVMPGYPKALSDLEGFRSRIVGELEMPGGQLLARQLFTLPTHGGLHPGDLAQLADWLRQYGRET
jgi:dTDP-4-amino-4,6-dideoxygalactose transaminase